ncbi:GbsR/MarR family transcriptional regulator [Catenulispora subtropica]|uniref:HTH marR-type domain-containing protein n=1 Tax=Catenulispora subtropica TaxID=450798 RepID=A0ABP5CX04_9ACTN
MSKDAPPKPNRAQLLAYIERFASVLTDSGIPRMPSRVFAALLTEDDGRLTSQELAEMLDISPAAVSGAIRYLSQVGLVTRERDPGSRRDRYRVLDEVWQEVILHRDTVLARWESSLAEGVSVVGPETPAGRRLAESVVMFQFLRSELPGMLKRWYEQRAELRAAVAHDSAAAHDGSVARALAARPDRPEERDGAQL